LQPAIHTPDIVLDELDVQWSPVEKSGRWNERHYGALQGLCKAETAEKLGDDQVHIWRRSYETPPEPLEESDPRHPKHDPRYADLPANELPATECLKDTVERFLPYWEKEVAPVVKSGKNVIVAAHGNTIRALVKYLDNISD